MPNDKTTEKVEIKDRLRSVRIANGKTQEQFADIIKVSTDLVKKMEQGATPLTPDNALAVAKAFKVSLDWLLGLDINAKSIHCALKDRLKIDNPLHPDGERPLTLYINKHLLNFLIAISKAEESKNIPELYEDCIQKAERDYTGKLEIKEKDRPLEYLLRDLD